MRGRIRLRALSTALVALVATAGLLGGCGRGPSKADLAAQDKVVELGNQLASVHRRVVQAQRLVARQRRAAAQLAASPNRSAAAANAARGAGAANLSLANLCRPIKTRGNVKTQRRRQRQRERARQRALSFLNLSCATPRA